MEEEIIRCKMCNRKLTDETSKVDGVGPKCMKRIDDDWAELEEKHGKGWVKEIEELIEKEQKEVE